MHVSSMQMVVMFVVHGTIMCFILSVILIVFDRLMQAIRKVESGANCQNKDPCNLVGDNGLALGPYQIHRVYYSDAVQFRPQLTGSYRDVVYDSFAQRIIQVRRHKSRSEPTIPQLGF